LKAVKTIRCGRGLGDSLYLQAVARHLRQQGQKLRVATDYPEIFSQLDVETMPFNRLHIDIVAHYSARRGYKDTTQFEDCCLQAGISRKTEFKIDWSPVKTALIDSLISHGKPILLVQMARNPMNRTDGFGMEVLPKCEVIQAVIDRIKEHCLIVLIGGGKSLFKFQNIDIDLSNKTSVTDLLDIASCADGMLGYCSFMVPLAESFDKPALFVWSKRSLVSTDQVIRSMTPQKILHKTTSHYLLDSADHASITEKADEFLRQINRTKSD
jgi:hypothetical protein